MMLVQISANQKSGVAFIHIVEKIAVPIAGIFSRIEKRRLRKLLPA